VGAALAPETKRRSCAGGVASCARLCLKVRVADGETFDAGGATWSVQLPHFEGPLDLLLHLCQKHELNILDIPIGFITEKYLEYLAVMQLMQLDLAAEYLVMAATLAHIKSKMLLPAPPPGQEDDEGLDEEEIDPREALIRRLLEYQKYKHAGEQLTARGVSGRDVFPRGMPVEEAVTQGLAPLAEMPLFSLVEAFQRVLDRSKVRLTHDIVADRLSLTDRIGQLADVLAVRKRMAFEELFEGLASKFDLVITFLALLEMTRLKMTRLFQSEPLGPLYVEMSAEAPQTDSLDENDPLRPAASASTRDEEEPPS
jgi:segregation and condensation protein A